MTESRLVIGVGASGRSHTLRTWVGDLGDEAAQEAVWLTGSPLKAIAESDVSAAIKAAPSVIVADDVQWFERDALATLTEMADDVLIFASRRPETGAELGADALELFCEILGRAQAPDRIGPLDIDDFAVALAALRAAESGTSGRALASEDVELLFEATRGLVGLAADAVAGGWDGRAEQLPESVGGAVVARVRRAGAAGANLLTTWAILASEDVSAPLETALAMAPEDLDRELAERQVRTGGLATDDGTGQAVLIPLVGMAARANMTSTERAAIHDRIAERLAPDDQVGAAKHLLSGSGNAPEAPQILASAALRLAVTEPDEADDFIERAQRLGLPEAEGALLQALAAFHRGSPDSLAHLERAQSSAPAMGDRMAVLGYGIDLRDLRFEAALSREISGDLAEPLRRLAAALAGDLTSAGDDSADSAAGGEPSDTPLGRLLVAMGDGVASLADGASSDAVGALTNAVDDFDRLEPTAPFGITPHSLGALAALTVGDLSVVEILTRQAVERNSGGVGEAFAHRLLRAYGDIIEGEYGASLALVRDHAAPDEDESATAVGGAGRYDSAQPDQGSELDDNTSSDDASSDDGADDGASAEGAATLGRLLCQRDRLLLASLEAAIARRSGDTSRIRAAWKRAEEALIRPSTSWLLADFFVELLACGTRLGDSRRVEPIVDALVEQGLALPAEGPGPVGAHWLRLQVAIAAEDLDTVIATADLLTACKPTDPRSLARIAAGGAWASVMLREANEGEIVRVAELLSAVGDGWEASRLLGQAALDEADPKAARRLLELARTTATEHVDESGGEGLSALGLSEREAEVALLVSEGRTHKEVGAQLYISPKTVEHHVAKIRQKLGASSRAELLSIIRDAVDGA